jgi:hypothetical protein
MVNKEAYRICFVLSNKNIQLKFKTMQQFIKGLFMIGSLALVFTSCKKEELNSAPQPPVEAMASARGGVLPAAPVYQLTKLGSDSLVYYNDGRLAKVLHGRAGSTQYNYTGFNTVVAKKYSGTNSQPDQEIVYQVDVKTGNVYESAHTEYTTFNGGALAVKTTYKYEYNVNGQLTKKYNKDKPNERAEFTWGNEDLSQIRFYDKDNKEYKIVQYGNVWVKTALRIHLPSTGIDVYLNKFGKPTKNAAGVESIYDPAIGLSTPVSHIYFGYTMNADGYPVKCNQQDANTWQIINTLYYGYLVK